MNTEGHAGREYSTDGLDPNTPEGPRQDMYSTADYGTPIYTPAAKWGIARLRQHAAVEVTLEQLLEHFEKNPALFMDDEQRDEYNKLRASEASFLARLNIYHQIEHLNLLTRSTLPEAIKDKDRFASEADRRTQEWKANPNGLSDDPVDLAGELQQIQHALSILLEKVQREIIQDYAAVEKEGKSLADNPEGVRKTSSVPKFTKREYNKIRDDEPTMEPLIGKFSAMCAELYRRSVIAEFAFAEEAKSKVSKRRPADSPNGKAGGSAVHEEIAVEANA